MKNEFQSSIALPPLKTYIDFLYAQYKIITACSLIGLIIGIMLIITVPAQYISTALIATGTTENDKFSSANKALELYKFHLQSEQPIVQDPTSKFQIISEIFNSAYVNKSDNAITIQSKSPDPVIAQKNVTIAGDDLLNFLNSKKSNMLQKLNQKLDLDYSQIKQIDDSLKIVSNRIQAMANGSPGDLTSLLLYKNSLASEKFQLQHSTKQVLASIEEINASPSYYLKVPSNPRISTSWFSQLAISTIAGLIVGIFAGFANIQFMLRSIIKAKK
ncbi:hypothetical protein [Polynucleobacter sp. MWH-UH23A]|uniref:hypothetical protein n=1 Tax=Polynucleobacter sp. MWH-UH23A TaxID=1855613 RepID=UPI003364B583